LKRLVCSNEKPARNRPIFLLSGFLAAVASLRRETYFSIDGKLSIVAALSLRIISTSKVDLGIRNFQKNGMTDFLVCLREEWRHTSSVDRKSAGEIGMGSFRVCSPRIKVSDIFFESFHQGIGFPTVCTNSDKVCVLHKCDRQF
jgi:hypothetical protein